MVGRDDMGRRKIHYKIRQPDGVVVDVINYQDFADSVGVSRIKMKELIDGWMAEYRGFSIVSSRTEELDELREELKQLSTQLKEDKILCKKLLVLTKNIQKRTKSAHESRIQMMELVRALERESKNQELFERHAKTNNKKLKSMTDRKIIATDPEGKRHFFTRNSDLANAIGGKGIDFKVHKLLRGDIDSLEGWTVVFEKTIRKTKK